MYIYIENLLYLSDPAMCHPISDAPSLSLMSSQQQEGETKVYRFSLLLSPLVASALDPASHIDEAMSDG